MQADWMKHQAIKLWLEGWGRSPDCFLHLLLHFLNAPINVKPVGWRGGGRAWGGDLIVFVGPGFDQSCSPGEGDILIFLRPTWDRRGDGFDCRLGRKGLRPNIFFPTSALHARDVRPGKICHAFYTWASCSDDRGNPIPRIDVNKLIDWLIDCNVLFGDIFIMPFLGSALRWTAMCSLGWGGIWRQIFEKCQIPTPCPAFPPPHPAGLRLNIDRCINLTWS